MIDSSSNNHNHHNNNNNNHTHNNNNHNKDRYQDDVHVDEYIRSGYQSPSQRELEVIDDYKMMEKEKMYREALRRGTEMRLEVKMIFCVINGSSKSPERLESSLLINLISSSDFSV